MRRIAPLLALACLFGCVPPQAGYYPPQNYYNPYAASAAAVIAAQSIQQYNYQNQLRYQQRLQDQQRMREAFGAALAPYAHPGSVTCKHGQYYSTCSK